MARLVVNLFLIFAFIFAPTMCCCTARLFASTSAPTEPAKKACCNCEEEQSPAKDQEPKHPAPCKCKAKNLVLASGQQENETAAISQAPVWLAWLDLAVLDSRFLGLVPVATTSHFHLSLSPVSASIASAQIAIISQLTC